MTLDAIAPRTSVVASRQSMRLFTVAFTGLALVAGTAGTLIDLRLGFVASALILGWTQLAGL
ncbi:MAG: hypothetical protein ACREON_19560 [Gemmatimonadaceae bacterium]